jgi:sugar diacid utilization regulator
MTPDRKQMMDERKSLMREFRQVRQAMHVGKKEKPEKGKPEKNDVDPREVLMEIRNRAAGRKEQPVREVTSVVVMVGDGGSISTPVIKGYLP